MSQLFLSTCDIILFIGGFLLYVHLWIWEIVPLNENECFLPQPAISGKQMSLLKGNFENVSNVVHIFSFHSLQGVPTDNHGSIFTSNDAQEGNLFLARINYEVDIIVMLE